MAHAGEEQGLVGAWLHAQEGRRQKIPIQAVFNNDIVGNDRGGNGIVDGATIRVYSEGPEDSPSRALARFVAAWGGRYVPSHEVRPMSRPDRFGRGGDHSAYNQLGFAAVGFRESRENFTSQHDVARHHRRHSLPYLRRTRASTPPPRPRWRWRRRRRSVTERGQPTITRAPSGYDANLTWNASPGASAYASSGAKRGDRTGSTR